MASIDRREARKAIKEAAEPAIDSFGRATVERFVEMANDRLRAAAANPPAGASQDEWDLEPIIESVEIRREGERWVAEWTAETDDGFDLASAFEFGVDPHVIPGAPVLHWTDEETGEDVFRARVEHPGIPAVAFVRGAKTRIEAQIERGDIEEIRFT